MDMILALKVKVKYSLKSVLPLETRTPLSFLLLSNFVMESDNM